MKYSQRDWEVRLQDLLLRSERAEQDLADGHHALNLLLNGSFDLFHTVMTENGAVHEFLIGVVRNVPVSQGLSTLGNPDAVEDRRIILWKTTFEPRGTFATAYSEERFRSAVIHLPTEELELRTVMENAIELVPAV